jgi:hypothetical protein
MACRVTLCDDTFTAINNSKIDIEAYDPVGFVSIDRQPNTRLSAAGVTPQVWGASLTVGLNDIYNVVIDATGTSFASNVLEDINGAETPELDVILFATTAAVSPTKPGPSTSAAVKKYVQSQPWPDVAKKAILSSIHTYSFLRAAPDNKFKELRSHLEQLLKSVEINPELIA